MTAQRVHRRQVPHRTCVACRTVRPKRDLVRVVRVSATTAVVDERGKMNGRGAYLCAQRVCWDEALKRRRLDAALRMSLDEETRSNLRAFAQNLPERLEIEDQDHQVEA